jgi:endonuclease YncB( thermonuclease family)
MKTLNHLMVEEGLARLSKQADGVISKLGKSSAVNLVEEMKEAQELARRGRIGMWRYGDVADSDDEDAY